MRISDWSSDVCSSDLLDQSRKQRRLRGVEFFGMAVEIMERGGTQPIAIVAEIGVRQIAFENLVLGQPRFQPERSEEHTSELQSLMRISYAVFCLHKKNIQHKH